MMDDCVNIYSQLDEKFKKNKYPKSNLLRLREKSKETTQQVADAIGCSRTTYENYERNENDPKYRPPDATMLKALSKHFSVSTDYILGLDDCTSVTNQLISDKIGLSDTAIELLKEWHKEPDRYSADISILDMLLSYPDKTNIEVLFNQIFLYIASDFGTPYFATTEDYGDKFTYSENPELGNPKDYFEKLWFYYPFESVDNKVRKFMTRNALEYSNSLIRTNCIDNIRELLDMYRNKVNEDAKQRR